MQRALISQSDRIIDRNNAAVAPLQIVLRNLNFGWLLRVPAVVASITTPAPYDGFIGQLIGADDIRLAA